MTVKSAPRRQSIWKRRIERTRALKDRPSTAVVPLRFYEIVLRFQADLAEGFEAAFDSTRPMRDQIDLEFAASRWDGLLTLAAKHGPEELSNRAQELRRQPNSTWKTMLESAVEEQFREYSLDDFFSRACIQPMAENLQAQSSPPPHYLKNICPACGGLPQLSILRPEGEGASRSLLCSFCFREWNFRRIICPFCGEEDKEKLPQYSAPECGTVSVEACETCLKYLKAVDMTADGHAEPLVDEAAVAALDVWAREHGYIKIVRNLIGF